MSKTASGLLSHCKQAVNNNVKYVYGAKMQVLTRQQILNLQSIYGKSYVWNSDLSKADKLCCDCSGLISSYTGIIRSSSNYKATATEVISISTLKANWSKYVGWGLWMSGHIGVVSDTEGYYYAMDGSARNMVHYPLSKQGWSCAIKLRDIDYVVEETVKEDEEMVTEGKAIVNRKEYKIDRILKDGINYIRAANFGNMGFQVAYDAETKSVVIDNRVDKIDVNVGGKDVKVNAVNIDGYNYVNLREITKALGKEVDIVDGEIVIR